MTGLWVCLFVLVDHAYSFTPKIWSAKTGRLSPWALRSTTIPPADTKPRNPSVIALEKLLEKQRAELRDTERLLSLVQSPSDTVEKGKAKLEGETQTVSMAVSLLAGFDYGFVSRSEGAKPRLKGGLSNQDYGPPANVLLLGSDQFMRNLNAMRGEYLDEEDVELTSHQKELRTKLKALTLNSTAIWERELADGPIEAPLLIKVPYFLVCYLLDVVFEGKYVPSRFFLLETVARMPYFSYISALHLYETLGFWRRSADMKRIHFAEEINEYSHLLIMESLGGDQSWWVRFLAQHSAIVYYIVLLVLWALSPSLSYRFSELLETHAVNTYGVFLDENEELLRQLPPSKVAVEYYCIGANDPLYTEIQTSASSLESDFRRPGENMTSLYDVFSAIRADEGDHVSTMQACLDPSVAVQSPSLEKRVLWGVALVGAISFMVSSGMVADMLGSLSNADLASDAAIVTDETSMTAMVDAMLAGGAGLMQRMSQSEESGDLGKLGRDLTEFGAVGLLETVRRNLVVILEFIGALIAALL